LGGPLGLQVGLPFIEVIGDELPAGRLVQPARPNSLFEPRLNFGGLFQRPSGFTCNYVREFATVTGEWPVIERTTADTAGGPVSG